MSDFRSSVVVSVDDVNRRGMENVLQQVLRDAYAAKAPARIRLLHVTVECAFDEVPHE